jgi:ferritin-like metal-binding protein YciE
MNNKKFVFVVGMHRSGTSLLTSILNRMGMHLGEDEDISYSNEENKRGFFENRKVVDLNDRILKGLGLSWSNPYIFTPSDGDRVLSANRNEAVDLICETFENQCFAGMKDPRLCILLQFWRDIVERYLDSEIFTIYQFRHPISVAKSLFKRSKMYPKYVCGQEDHSIHLWMKYYVEALKNSSGISNHISEFNEVIGNPQGKINDLISFLKFDAPQADKIAIEKLIDIKEAHHFPEKRPKFSDNDDYNDIEVWYSNIISVSHQNIILTADLLKDYSDSLNNISSQYQYLLERYMSSLFENYSHSKEIVVDHENTIKNTRIHIKRLENVINEKDISLNKYASQCDKYQELLNDKNTVAEKLHTDINELKNKLIASLNASSHLKNTNSKLLMENDLLLQSNESLLQSNEHLRDESSEFLSNVYRYAQENSFKIGVVIFRKIHNFFMVIKKIKIIQIINVKLSKIYSLRRKKNIAKWLLKDPIFDPNYIVKIYPDLAHLTNHEIAIYYLDNWLQKSIYPSDLFNPKEYLSNNLDVLLLGLDPLYHYLRYGKIENREISSLSCRKKYQFQEGKNHHIEISKTADDIQINASDIFQKEKTALIVTHESSRTGAPILTLNISHFLKQKYNVIICSLGSGDLDIYFKNESDEFFEINNHNYNENIIYTRVLDILDQFKISFCIVNSIVSRYVLPACARKFIPTIQLVHEYSVYTSPRNAFLYSIWWSHIVIFSSKSTLSNAFKYMPKVSSDNTSILPQGKCLYELNGNSDGEYTHLIEEDLFFENLKKRKRDDSLLIVLGAGYVQYRKGIDIFLLTAKEVSKNIGNKNILFLWIGSNFNPEKDMIYSAYISHQAEIVKEHIDFLIVDELKSYSRIYSLIDIFFLSSRLDPLPNVSIDAFLAGKPVVFFNQTTGLDDFIKICNKDCSQLIIPYLDISHAAKTIINLLDDRSLYESISHEVQIRSKEFFNFTNYIDKLELEVNKAESLAFTEKEDYDYLCNNEILDLEFYVSPFESQVNIQDPYFQFVKDWKSYSNPYNNVIRKPYPGFHPGIYLEQNTLKAIYQNPLVHHHKAGSPDGPWNDYFISFELSEYDDIKLTNQASIAIHIHVYFIDVFRLIYSYIQKIKYDIDLFISVPDDDVKNFVYNILKKYERGSVNIITVNNFGRDIFPFLYTFGSDLNSKYDIVGHFHTKKSLDIQNRDFVSQWNHFIFSSILSKSQVNGIIAHFENDPKTGIVFADDPYVVGWDQNIKPAQTIMDTLTLKLPTSNFFNFPIGNMFWVRPKSISGIFNNERIHDLIPSEPLAYDGTTLHALERLWPSVVQQNGFTYKTTTIKNCTR